MRFEGGVELVAFQPRRRVVRPGEWLGVRTIWTAEARPAHRDKVFVQLLDATQALRSGSDREVLYGAVPMDEWRVGEVHRDVFFVRVPPDMPAGPALVQIGVYDRATRARRAVLGAAGQSVDDRILTGIYVERSGTDNRNRAGGDADGAGTDDFDVAFEGGPHLTAIDIVSDGPIRPGGVVTATLRWRADAPVDRDWTLFVHVLHDPADAAPAAQADGMPLGPLFPTRLWPRGAVLASTHAVRLPDDAANGAHWTLALGLYDAATLVRAAVSGQLPGGTVDAGDRRVRLPLAPASAPPATTAP